MVQQRFLLLAELQLILSLGRMVQLRLLLLALLLEPIRLLLLTLTFVLILKLSPLRSLLHLSLQFFHQATFRVLVYLMVRPQHLLQVELLLIRMRGALVEAPLLQQDLEQEPIS